MSQEQAEYITEAMELLHGEPAAEIHPPKTIKALRENGLNEYKVWGWVKTSSNFVYHIRKLRGAKLAIWQVISLMIDESGECKLSMSRIAELSGYSRSETIESVKELEGMGYLSAEKSSGKKSMYKPAFSARGENQPTNEINDQSRKATSPVSTHSYQSSPAREKTVPTSKELKELKNPLSKSEIAEIVTEANESVDAILELEKRTQERKSNGTAWRGRELLPDKCLPYADWWHAKTGLEMYGARVKAKLDNEWLKACNELWGNEVEIQNCDAAYEYENWRTLSKLSQIVPTAKALQALPQEITERPVTEGQGFYA